MKTLPHTLRVNQGIPINPTAPCYIKMRAINLAVNVDRAYEILFQRGLFNSWVVIISYGRYGQKGGQTKTYSFDLEAQAQSFFNKTLKKRLNASKRIGCNYRPTPTLV